MADVKILDEVRIEQLVFRLKVEGVELDDGNTVFVSTTLLVTFAKYDGEEWKLGNLVFVSGNFIRQAWPCPVPDDVQAWIDRKLTHLRGGWSVKP